MKSILIGSTRRSAGKTSVIVGLARAANKKFGYMKPFGDRLLYRKKRLWDYDAALVSELFALNENPEDITVGFEHAKLRYMYDEKSLKQKLQEIASRASKGKDILFIEGPRDLSYGSSIDLDAIRIAKYLGVKLVLIVGGSRDDVIADDIAFVKRYLDVENVTVAGVIINKVKEPEEFKTVHLPEIKKMGIPLLGIIPYEAVLSHLTVGRVAEHLFAKIVTGEDKLGNVIKNIFIGAMSADAAMNNPLFKKENKLIITSGDRSDMILAAIETNASSVVLTNNLLPSSNVLSRATERGIPLLLVPSDTYQIAKQIVGIEPLLTRGDTENINILTKLVKENVDLAKLGLK